MLMPAYRPLVRVRKSANKKIRVWPEVSSEAFQDCFSNINLRIFRQAAIYNIITNLNEYTNPWLHGRCHSHQNHLHLGQVDPWLTGTVHSLSFVRNNTQHSTLTKDPSAFQQKRCCCYLLTMWGDRPERPKQGKPRKFNAVSMTFLVMSQESVFTGIFNTSHSDLKEAISILLHNYQW